MSREASDRVEWLEAAIAETMPQCPLCRGASEWHVYHISEWLGSSCKVVCGLCDAEWKTLFGGSAAAKEEAMWTLTKAGRVTNAQPYVGKKLRLSDWKAIPDEFTDITAVIQDRFAKQLQAEHALSPSSRKRIWWNRMPWLPFAFIFGGLTIATRPIFEPDLYNLLSELHLNITDYYIIAFSIWLIPSAIHDIVLLCYSLGKEEMPTKKFVAVLVILAVLLPTPFLMVSYPRLEIDSSRDAIMLHSDETETYGSIKVVLGGSGILTIHSITISEDNLPLRYSPPFTTSGSSYFPLEVHLQSNLELYVHGKPYVSTYDNVSTITVTIEGTWTYGFINMPVSLTTSTQLKWT